MFKNIRTAQGKQLLHQPLNPRKAAESKWAATHGECTDPMGSTALRRKAQALWLCYQLHSEQVPLTRLGGCV